MKKDFRLDSQGFISTIISIVIGLVILKIAFNFDAIEYIKNSTLSSFLDDITRLITNAWSKIK